MRELGIEGKTDNFMARGLIGQIEGYHAILVLHERHHILDLLPDRHLARMQLADLFLDGLPYNAHTTGSDTLWAGVPLITLRGATFPGRVAASLLTAAGLPELVTQSRADFEALAIKLASNAKALKALRGKVAKCLARARRAREPGHAPKIMRTPALSES